MKRRMAVRWGIAGIFLLSQFTPSSFAQSKSDPAVSFLQIGQFLKEEIARPQTRALDEEALIGLAFLCLGDASSARAQLEKGIGMWNETGEAPLAGPQLWLALLSLQYERMTGDAQFHPAALEICNRFCALPRYHGIPAMGQESRDGIPWRRLVSLETARLGCAVLRLAPAARCQEEAQRLEAALKKIAPLPAGSLLLIGFEADAAGKAASENLREYQLGKNLYLAMEENLDRPVVNAGSTEELLKTYWGLLAAQNIPQQDKTVRYENLRQAVQSAENVESWLEENNVPALNHEEEWFVPESRKPSAGGDGAVNVCWDLFRGRWNPLGAALPPQVKVPEAMKNTASSQLFERARIQLVAGNAEKAEMLAQECVDQFGGNPACADQAASAWLLLGKIYHDRSQAASEKFMFSTAEDLEHKRDVAFQKVRTGYPTASVEDGGGFFSYVAEVIQNLYN